VSVGDDLNVLGEMSKTQYDDQGGTIVIRLTAIIVNVMKVVTTVVVVVVSGW
jgi:hypothetical protein